jgi:hypothetical protein
MVNIEMLFLATISTPPAVPGEDITFDFLSVVGVRLAMRREARIFFYSEGLLLRILSGIGDPPEYQRTHESAKTSPTAPHSAQNRSKLSKPLILCPWTRSGLRSSMARHH